MDGYNFTHYSLGKRTKLETIIRCLEAHPEGAQPKLISFETSIKHATIRGYLKELTFLDIVKKLPGGWYTVAKTMDGVKELPKIHNINLTLSIDDIQYQHKEIEEVVNDVKFKVTFGTENKKVTAVISAEPPLDYREFCFVVDKFKSIVSSYLGFIPEDSSIFVASCEFNIDYSDIRIEGCNAVTLTSLRGDLEKLYNKNGSLRSEVRVRSLPIEAVYTMLKGGFVNANIVQRQIKLDEKVDVIAKNVEVLPKVYRINSELMKQILIRLDKMSEKIGGYNG